MARVEVVAQIKVYEDDHSETWGDSEKHLTLKSHWNYPDAVVLIAEGSRYTIIAKDLRAALDAATVNR